MTETIAMIPQPASGGDPLIGRTIAGRFRVVSKLGEGGMGAVYKAEQLKVNRLCAVKILSASFAADPDALARFNREAQMSSAFSHPHAVTIYDFGDDDGLHYLAMEFVEGETLSSVLRREVTLSLPRTLGIARQACAALDAAHRLNIVHRDLKPDNIMICQRDGGDWVKILDFGIAKLAGDAPQRGQDLTQAGLVVGTPIYMSPEQLAGERLDARSDIYSLAIIIYQMLTGQLPFAGDNMQAIMVKRLTEDPLPIRAANPAVTVPPGVEAALMRALTRHRDQRTPTVRDFIGELEVGHGATQEVKLTPGRTQAQPAASSTSPLMPATSSFPGEEVYRTAPGLSPAMSTPPPLSPSTGAPALAPTVASPPPFATGGAPVPPSSSMPANQAFVAGSVAAGANPDMHSPPPMGQPPPIGFPPSPLPATAPAKSGSGTGIILAILAFVVVFVVGAGALGLYFFWPRDGEQPVSRDKPPPDKPKNTDNGSPTAPSNTSPSNAPKEAFDRGIRALAQKDYVTAERHFRDALDTAPGFGKAQLNLGIALYHQRKLSDALDRFAEAARICEDEACKNFAYNYRGRVHWEQREYALAEEDFRQAVAHDANDLSSLAFRGFMLRLGGQAAAANQLFDQVLARSRDETLKSVVRQCKGEALPPATASDAGIGPGQ
ncbi:MAG: protein kinase [Chloracidobacterium sp.]